MYVYSESIRMTWNIRGQLSFHQGLQGLNSGHQTDVASVFSPLNYLINLNCLLKSTINNKHISVIIRGGIY